MKILIVEDEMIIAAKISLHLTQMGYDVAGIVPRGEDAIFHCDENPPDVILMDINLKGQITGIDTVKVIQEKIDIPVIYLTANTDQDTFEIAKSTRPFAFITKPYKRMDLQRAVELAVSRMQVSKENASSRVHKNDDPYFLKDRIFIKHKETMIKLFLNDIAYIEADRSYCTIFTNQNQHLLSVPLKKLEDTLKAGNFFRIHRSYLVNLEKMDEVTESYIVIMKKTIPIGKSYKAEFLERIQTI